MGYYFIFPSWRDLLQQLKQPKIQDFFVEINTIDDDITKDVFKDIENPDWAAIPCDFRFFTSRDFALFIKGYDAPYLLGLAIPPQDMGEWTKAAGKITRDIYANYDNSLTWDYSAIELWIALFFTHRSERWSNNEYLMQDLPNARFDSLCQALRSKLIAGNYFPSIS